MTMITTKGGDVDDDEMQMRTKRRRSPVQTAKRTLSVGFGGTGPCLCHWHNGHDHNRRVPGLLWNSLPLLLSRLFFFLILPMRPHAAINAETAGMTGTGTDRRQPAASAVRSAWDRARRGDEDIDCGDSFGDPGDEDYHMPSNPRPRQSRQRPPRPSLRFPFRPGGPLAHSKRPNVATGLGEDEDGGEDEDDDDEDSGDGGALPPPHRRRRHPRRPVDFADDLQVHTAVGGNEGESSGPGRLRLRLSHSHQNHNHDDPSRGPGRLEDGGGGLQGPGPLMFPLGLACADDGTLYISDTFHHVIQMVKPKDNRAAMGFSQDDGDDHSGSGADEDGGDDHYRYQSRVPFPIAGCGHAGYLDGPAASARFREPRGIVVTSGHSLIVADTGNCAIRLVTPDGCVTTIAGRRQIDKYNAYYEESPTRSTPRPLERPPPVFGYLDGEGSEATFRSVEGLALSKDESVLYATDSVCRAIRKIQLWDREVTTLAGGNRVMEVNNNHIQYPFADGDLGEAFFIHPDALATDSTGRYLFVSSQLGDQRVRRIDLALQVVETVAGRRNARPIRNVDEFDSNAKDRNSNHDYVQDDGERDNHLRDRRRHHYSQHPQYNYKYADGRGRSASFCGIFDLICIPTGDLLLSDARSFSIRRLTPSLEVVRYAGDAANSLGYSDGPADFARFGFPTALAYSPATKEVYVADSLFGVIRSVFMGRKSRRIFKHLASERKFAAEQRERALADYKRAHAPPVEDGLMQIDDEIDAYVSEEEILSKFAETNEKQDGGDPYGIIAKL